MSKRLMPTYLVNFLKEIYDGTIPSNFGERMVSRQFIASVKELYETLGGDNPSDYSRRMVNEYLIKFFNEIEIVEYTDDDVKMTKTISSDLVYPACKIDSIGGMSYVVDGVIQDSPVTAVKTYNTDNELLDTYTVPSAITSLEGYGQGINSTVYNNVDFENKKFIQKVNRKQVKDYEWDYNSSLSVFFTPNQSDVKKDYNAGILFSNNLIEETTATIGNQMQNNTICFGKYQIQIGNNPNIQLKTDIVDNVTDFLTEFGNDYLYYELATPVETTITEQAPLLECIDSGSIVFENTYNQDMPNEVTTWIKGN